MKIWVLQTGEPIPLDQGSPRPMRAMNLIKSLLSNQHEVTLWTSRFYHQQKEFRETGGSKTIVEGNFTTHLIDSPGYSSNMGFARLYDHWVLAKNLGRSLAKNNDLPDVVFVGYPPIEIAKVMIDYCNRNRIPVLLDVKDLWPEIFVERVPIIFKPIAQVIFYPYFRMAAKAFSGATSLSAMSEQFLDWVCSFSKRQRSDQDLVVPLTSEKQHFSPEARKEAKIKLQRLGVNLEQGLARFVFVGSLTKAFDFRQIFEFADKLEALFVHFQIIIAGDGPEFAELSRSKDISKKIVFLGHIDQPLISELLLNSLAGVAPYKNTKDFRLSVPNKIYDFMLHELPILSSLEGATQRLLQSEGVGLHYNNSEELTRHALSLIEDGELVKSIKTNSRSVFSRKFDFAISYGALVAKLEELASHRKQFEKT